jgi:hypothetical protein
LVLNENNQGFHEKDALDKILLELKKNSDLKEVNSYEKLMFLFPLT